MNTNISQGTWKKLKGKLQARWGELNDDEFEKSKGNLREIAGSIQKKYGIEQDKAHSKINEMLNNINQKLS